MDLRSKMYNQLPKAPFQVSKNKLQKHLKTILSKSLNNRTSQNTSLLMVTVYSTQKTLYLRQEAILQQSLWNKKLAQKGMSKF